MTIAKGQTLYRQMFEGEQVNYFKLDSSFSAMRSGFTVVESSTCYGSHTIDFLKDP